MCRPKMHLTLLFLTAIVTSLAVSPPLALACERAGAFSFDELFAAHVIVRATAVKYAAAPDPSTRATGIPDATIEFKVEETLKGEAVPATIVLNGYLSDRDDYNDVGVPYRFVRPGGRAGSCFANTYREGAQFLLFLNRTRGGYTPDISALGPTNEQLRGGDDAWLRWVRDHLDGQSGKGGKARPDGRGPLALIGWALLTLSHAI